MRKKIQNLFSNIGVLILLIFLAIGLIVLFNRQTQYNQLTSQAPEAGATATAVGQKAVPTPTLAVKLPPDDLPAPTWTPVIVLPNAPQPTDPPRLPTPTPTPVNPNESVIATFDTFVTGLSISPDDRTLAVSADVETVPVDVSTKRQIWTIDLVSKGVKKLDVYGRGPIWSPDGQKILFNTNYGSDSIEFRMVDKDGRNEKSLMQLKKDEFLGVDWLAAERISLTKLDEIIEVDLSGKTVSKKALNLPLSLLKQPGKEVEQGQNSTIIALDREGNKLLIIRENGQTQEITDVEASKIPGRTIINFSLSNNKKLLAYVINEGPNVELWVSDLSSNAPRKLYRQEFGKIGDITWMPNDKDLLIGWAETGTNSEMFLFELNSETGAQKPIMAHGMDQGIILNHPGNKLFYTRTTEDSTNNSERTTVYELGIQ